MPPPGGAPSTENTAGAVALRATLESKSALEAPATTGTPEEQAKINRERGLAKKANEKQEADGARSVLTEMRDTHPEPKGKEKITLVAEKVIAKTEEVPGAAPKRTTGPGSE